MASELPGRRRQELKSALRTAARALGRRLDEVPADPRLLANRLAEVSPVAVGLSPGLCLAAADHCREQAGGAVGHHGRGGSDPESRISRYGLVAKGWAENIAYRQRSARAIVMALIIDDGVRGRGHCRNIFNRNYNAAGAASGPHARYGSVCSIDFASRYAEGTLVRVGTDTTTSF